MTTVLSQGVSGEARVRIVDPPMTLHTAATSFPVPTSSSVSVDGAAFLAAWKELGFVDDDAMIRFSASGATSIGDGTYANQLGVWGIRDGHADLLGILGVSTDGAAPRVPISGATGGFSVRVKGVLMYDDVVIGGVGATVTPSGGATVTVKMHRVSSIT